MSKKQSIKFEYVPFERLVFLDNNPRTRTPKGLERMAKDIERDPSFYENRPTLVNFKDGEMRVYAGDLRAHAANGVLNWKEIPCNIETDVPADIQARRAILDNTHFENWDSDLLSGWDFDVSDLEEMAVPGWVYGAEESDGGIPDNSLNSEAQEDDFEVPEVETVKTDIVLGDLFEIGPHRLLCGDSTKAEDVARLMGGAKADICFTSPPYNAGKNIRGYFYESDNDDKTSEDYFTFLKNTTINALSVCDFCFVNLQMLESNKVVLIDFQHHFKDRLKDVLIWNKSSCPPHINKGTFSTKFEFVFAFGKTGKSRSFPCDWQGKFPNVIETENASGNDFSEIHKATFPVAFPYWIISKMDFCRSVLDIFLGTGTTMVAAHQLNRKCYGMELSEKYCQVILDRMLKLDPTIEVKKNGQPYKHGTN